MITVLVLTNGRHTVGLSRDGKHLAEFESASYDSAVLLAEALECAICDYTTENADWTEG